MEGISTEETYPIPLQDYKEFQRYYPEGKISSTSFSSLPESVRELFKNKSEQFSDKPFDLSSLKNFNMITHPTGEITYSASHTKTLSTNGETDICLYVADTTTDDTLTGYGEVVTNISPKGEKSYYNMPFVGYTLTFEPFKRQGRGRQRLITMNALSQQINHLPLYSFGSMPEEQSIWNKLVEEGKAKRISEDRDDQYVFNVLPANSPVF